MDCLKRGAWTVCRFKRLCRKGRVVLLRAGELIPQSTLWEDFINGKCIFQ